MTLARVCEAIVPLRSVDFACVSVEATFVSELRGFAIWYGAVVWFGVLVQMFPENISLSGGR